MLQSSLESAAPPASTEAGSANGKRSGALAVAGTAGVFASACCIGPLVLAAIGLGGAAAGVVAVFEPLRPVFIVIALAALGFAGWKIYRRPPMACEPGAACAQPPTDHIYKTAFWIVSAVVLALLASPYYIPLIY